MPGPNSADTERGSPASAQGAGAGQVGGEFAAIERLAARLAERAGAVPAGEVWIGDDTAVLAPPTGRLLLTVDVAVAGVHADLAVVSVADLGWRALVASVSDVCAMGGRPLAAVVAVAGPPDTDLDALYAGLAEAAAAYACPVVGGDLSTAEVLSLSVTVAGDVPGEPGPVLRSGARAGERIWVTGPLGSSAAGLRQLRRAGAGATGPLADAHRRPVARPDEGTVARRAGATAMIDVSDGLLADLGRLADASGVGFDVTDVPVAEGASLDDALGGGDDYELVLVAPAGAMVEDAFTAAGLAAPLPIGTCHADPAHRTLVGRPAPRLGWEHPFVGPAGGGLPDPGGGR